MIGPSFPVRILGQIITFIWFAEDDISKIQHLSYVSGNRPGLYTMIETLERPLRLQRLTIELWSEAENN
jgi:hypothetical protein